MAAPRSCCSCSVTPCSSGRTRTDCDLERVPYRDATMKESMKVLYQFPQSAGKPFRPCNGTEGMMFNEVFCNRCWRDAKYRRTRDGRDGCPILAASFLHNVGDEGYPKEWVFNSEGWPVCTA